MRSWSPSLAISLGPGNSPFTETRLFVWQRRVTLCIFICQKKNETSNHIICNPSGSGRRRTLEKTANRSQNAILDLKALIIAGVNSSRRLIDVELVKTFVS
ncbi:hypothetical protein IGI04_009702 [Brassica rapa subsp. trilocularis]|uniref:Uncharacterized protein n=1 Tax=Brassica rapa subsp. trilocularis TaxID=1813537 RepID=A0ABQ7MY26_BRACM|nr:hypothetical protein IGI04_009702 [Brassica rapa subsp. trilocularis]